MADQPPLTTLLSWVWIAHVIEADNAFEVQGAARVGRRFRISYAMWANGLRLVDEEGVTVGELHRRAGAACNIAGLERWGWIHVGDASAGRRAGYGTHAGVKPDTVLRPTRGGSYARRLWSRVVAEVEQRWRARFGGGVIDALRQAAALESPMPWAVPEVHPSDGFRTHVSYGAAGGGAPLVALIAQRLTAFTVEHERESSFSLPLGANLLRAVGSDLVRMRDLPMLTGVSKEGVAMATGFLGRHRSSREGREGANRTIQLTERGLAALDDYRRRIVLPADEPLRGALSVVLEQGEALSACFAPPDGCWRGEKPYLTQTRRLMADPTGTMPWHPMVLHRGGWPDGS